MEECDLCGRETSELFECIDCGGLCCPHCFCEDLEICIECDEDCDAAEWDGWDEDVCYRDEDEYEDEYDEDDE